MLNQIKHIIKPLILGACSTLGQHKLPNLQPKLWVLMYHRILPKSDPRFFEDEPGMVVTPESFELHITTLKRYFDVVPLNDWIRSRDKGGKLPSKACAITFDDGWLDNYEFALPILKKHQVPATLFVVADMIGTQREFWPNRLIRLLPNPAALACDNPLIDWLFSQKAISKASVFDTEALADIINRCKTQSDHWLHLQLDHLESALNLAPAEGKPSLMNWDQVKEMRDSGLVEIGSHTCNHFRLNEGLDAAIAEEEVIRSKQLIDDKLGGDTQLFCYPNGDTSALAQKLVAKHYQAAVTTQKGINSIGANAHELLRIGVHEDISDTRVKFEARMSGLL